MRTKCQLLNYQVVALYLPFKSSVLQYWVQDCKPHVCLAVWFQDSGVGAGGERNSFLFAPREVCIDFLLLGPSQHKASPPWQWLTASSGSHEIQLLLGVVSNPHRTSFFRAPETPAPTEQTLSQKDGFQLRDPSSKRLRLNVCPSNTFSLIPWP